jgi:pimeloyl-ACP methyl ester carboxylesterase
VLEATGWASTAVDYGGVSGPDWYGGAATRIAKTLGDANPLVLVVHSGAGGFVPSLAAALADRVAGFLFVDAVMPYPGKRWFDTASPVLAKRVREIAEDGLLPPWDTWFGPGAIEALIPDPARRAAFSADLPRVPLAYLEAVASPGEAWPARPCGYLQLSEACATEADQAEALGWSVRRERLNHLAMLTHPDRVAAILAEMALQLERA